MFLKNRNIISKMKRSKVTDYAALKVTPSTRLCLNAPYKVQLNIQRCVRTLACGGGRKPALAVFKRKHLKCYSSVALPHSGFGWSAVCDRSKS